MRRDANTTNALESLKDRLDRGECTAAQANVELVRMERVRVVAGKVPRDVRKALNDAVRSGELAHKKQDGFKPEVYYHPSFEHLANGERRAAEQKAHAAIAKVAGWPAA